MDAIYGAHFFATETIVDVYVWFSLYIFLWILNFTKLNVYPSDFKMQYSERCHRVEFKENNAAK